MDFGLPLGSQQLKNGAPAAYLDVIAMGTETEKPERFSLP
jgi:hypothetical protein